MLGTPDTLETVAQDLDEARAKVDEARQALQAALDAQDDAGIDMEAGDRPAGADRGGGEAGGRGAGGADG